MLLILVPLILVLDRGITGSWLDPQQGPAELAVVVFIPVLVVAFLAGRTRTPAWGAHVLVWYLLGAIVIIAGFAGDLGENFDILMALPVPVVLASFLLGAASTTVVFTAGTIVHVMVPSLQGGRAFDLGGFAIYLLITVPIMMSAYVSRRAILETTTLAHRLDEERERATTAELELREMTDHISDVFWLTSPDGDEVIYVSPQYEELWDQPVDRVKEDPRAWLNAVHPQDLDRVRERIPLHREGGYDVRYRILRSNGGLRWVRDRAFPVRNAAGEVVRVARVTADITDQKRLEQMREHALEEAGRRAELEQVVYVTSHNLQEPLRDINRFAQLLERTLADRLSPDEMEPFTFIQGGVKRLQERIDALRNYAEVSTAIRSMERMDVQLVVERILQDLGVEADVRQVLDDASLPPVEADPRQFRQLLHELLENAYRFHEDGRAPTVRLSARREGSQVRYDITDDGIGIDPEHHERVFRLFERLHPDRFPGAGLGLAVARRVVERHGGRIGIQGAPGGGTTVWFTLPAAEAS